MWILSLSLALAQAEEGAFLEALAEDFFVDRWTAPAPSIAARYAAACEAEIPLACAPGWHRPEGARLGDGLRAFEEACAEGTAPACVAAGWALSRRQPWSLDRRAPDPQRAEQHFRAACEAGSTRGCIELARLRAFHGDTDALAELEERCTGSPQACWSLAQLTPSAPARRSLYERACPQVPAACLQAAVLGAESEPVPEAVERYEESCHEGAPRACVALGEHHQERWSDLDRAAALYVSGCNGGEPRGCTLLALLHQATGLDPIRTTELFAMACAEDEPLACAWLGIRLARGQGGPPQPERAAEVTAKACELGVGWACGVQALGLRGSDPDRATSLMQEACDARVDWACERLLELYRQQRPPPVGTAPRQLVIDEALLVDGEWVSPWPELDPVALSLHLLRRPATLDPLALDLRTEVVWGELLRVLVPLERVGFDQIAVELDGEPAGSLLLVEGSYRGQLTVIVDRAGILLHDPAAPLAADRRIACRRCDRAEELGERLRRRGVRDVLLAADSARPLRDLTPLLRAAPVRITPAWLHTSPGPEPALPRDPDARWRTPRRPGTLQERLMAAPDTGSLLVALSEQLSTEDPHTALLLADRAVERFPRRKAARAALARAAAAVGDGPLAEEIAATLPPDRRPELDAGAGPPESPQIVLPPWFQRPQPLSAAEFMGVMQSHRPAFETCYEQAVERTPRDSGRVLISATIGLDGRVADATIVSSDLDLQAGACLIAAMRGIQLRPLPTVWFGTYPLLFE